MSTDPTARGYDGYGGQLGSLKTLTLKPEDLLSIGILSLTASVTSNL